MQYSPALNSKSLSLPSPLSAEITDVNHCSFKICYPIEGLFAKLTQLNKNSRSLLGYFGFVCLFYFVRQVLAV
jgi:hypothetical protein